MTATIPSSAAEVIADPAAFLRALRSGDHVAVPDLDYRAAAALAEEELLEETVSYRKAVTGVDNTIFISAKGSTQRAARIKLAIDPPNSIDPRRETASIAVADGAVMAGKVVPAAPLKRVQQFIELNRAALIDCWEYRIDTEELRQRLRSI